MSGEEETRTQGEAGLGQEQDINCGDTGYSRGHLTKHFICSPTFPGFLIARMDTVVISNQ